MKAFLLFRAGMVSAIVTLATLAPSTYVFADGAAPTVSAKSISKVPFVITAPGTYIVKKDLVLASATGAAITINASDVILDLGGRVISCSAPQNAANLSRGINLAGSPQNVIVCNGTLKNFQYGVYMIQSGLQGRLVAERVFVDNAGKEGIHLEAGQPEVVGCHVKGAGYQSDTLETHGISVYGNNVRIINNAVSELKFLGGPGSLGIYVTVNHGGLIERNVVAAQSLGSYGIACISTAPGGTSIVENTIQSFSTGINIGGNGKYRGNMTFDCVTPFNGGTAVGTENN
jgi:hypothetical protein